MGSLKDVKGCFGSGEESKKLLVLSSKMSPKVVPADEVGPTD